MSRLLQSKVQYRSLLATKPPTAILSRSFCASKRSMVDAKDISPSKGENASDLAAQATSLVDSGRWNLWNNGKGLERQFKFKTFKATWVSISYPLKWTAIGLLTPRAGFHERGRSRVQKAKTPP